MPRFQVAVPFGAMAMIERVYEIEAPDEEEAKRLVLSDEAWELDDDQFFLVDENLLRTSGEEMDPSAEDYITATQVG